MVKMKRLFRKGFLSSVLAASLILGGVPLNGFLTPVLADTEKTITGLGTGAIGDPVAPENRNSSWSGSYVYYGKYDGTNPTKYRVLDKATTKFGGNTLFLDCDSTLYDAKFDNDINPDAQGHYPNEWAFSDVRKDINGNAFLEKDGCFSDAEKDAIALSTIKGHALVKADDDNVGEAGKVTEWSQRTYKNYVELSNEKVFFLDAEDVSNIEYGYSMTDNSCKNHVKTGSDSGWWLRSPFSYGIDGAGRVNRVGIVNYEAVISELGVSPAFNVNLKSVIFTSLISGSAGQAEAEYKLTLKDDNMNIAVTDGKAVTRKDDTVTVPYTITTGTNAGNATQVSVLVTDKPYEAGKAVTSGFYYKKLNVGSWNTSGTGTFDIPNTYRDKISGKDYHIYILAEDVNGEKETDYASKPVEIHVHTLKHYDRKEPSDTSEGNIEYWECSGCGKLFKDEACTEEITLAETVIPKKQKEELKEGSKVEPVITPSDNKAMDVRPETVDGGYEITYPHQIPFQGKGKLTAESFGENFTVSQGNATYKVKKIKANKKKHRIQILKLENAPKDVEKAVKKATKGDNGIPYTQNPYYVKDTDKVTAKFKKSGAAASVKVNISGKDYKAKKTEYEYDSSLKLITFKGDNLAGSWAVN